jgi:hypothetical protein
MSKPEESLEQRVARLEQQLAAGQRATDESGREWSLGELVGLGLSRREALVALGAIAAGYGAREAIISGIGTAEAASASGSIGTSNNRVDAFLAGVNATGDITDAGNSKTVYDSSTQTVGDGTTSADHQSLSTDSASIGGQPSINYWPPVYEDGVTELNESSPATSYTKISLSEPPADATYATLRLQSQGDGTSNRHLLQVRESGTARTNDAVCAGWAGHGAFDGDIIGVCPINSSNEIDYKSTQSSQVIIKTVGYF